MSDSDRAPVIELQLDQEVFVDIVREGDVVDDATVATEVTSFDRVGDAYVLEGAVIFAGYLRHHTVVQDDSEMEDALSVDTQKESFVQHIHHRMPFALRVPGKFQPRGLVNVASRIRNWELNVLGAGWLQVIADLQVVGLNGAQGYHFQCGAQETGDVFFHAAEAMDEESRAVEHAEPASLVEHANDLVSDEDVSMPLSTAEAHAVSATPTDFSTEDEQLQSEVVQAVHRDQSDVEHAKIRDTLSSARGGASGDEYASEESQALGPHGSVAELRDFDRVFDGESVPSRALEEAERGMPRIDEPWDMSDGKGLESAEYEFEHQVNATELKIASETSGRRETFAPSRSFSEQGFQPGAGFSSSLPSAEAVKENMVSNDVRGEVEKADDADVVRAQMDGEHTNPLWSFVDFNEPDTRSTLRFVIAQEDETLASLAERLGCDKGAIQHANDLASEAIESGQAIYIPTSNHQTTSR